MGAAGKGERKAGWAAQYWPQRGRFDRRGGRGGAGREAYLLDGAPAPSSSSLPLRAGGRAVGGSRPFSGPRSTWWARAATETGLLPLSSCCCAACPSGSPLVFREQTGPGAEEGRSSSRGGRFRARIGEAREVPPGPLPAGRGGGLETGGLSPGGGAPLPGSRSPPCSRGAQRGRLAVAGGGRGRAAAACPAREVHAGTAQGSPPPLSGRSRGELLPSSFPPPPRGRPFSAFRSAAGEWRSSSSSSGLPKMDARGPPGPQWWAAGAAGGAAQAREPSAPPWEPPSGSAHEASGASWRAAWEMALAHFPRALPTPKRELAGPLVPAQTSITGDPLPVAPQPGSGRAGLPHPAGAPARLPLWASASAPQTGLALPAHLQQLGLPEAFQNQQLDPSLAWQCFSEVLVQLRDRLDNQEPRPGPAGETGDGGAPRGLVYPTVVGDMSASEGATQPSKKGSKRKRKRACSHPSSDSSEEEEDGDSPQKEERYWLEGAFIPGLPDWLQRRREVALRDQGEQGPSTKYLEVDEPPGIYMPRKVRERALNGYYIDIFSLFELEGATGKTKKTGVERNFPNWLRGYAEYLGLIAVAYPERGWHLIRHLSNVLEARALAGEAAAMDYDESFRKRASHNAQYRWDIKNYHAWLTKVIPHVKQKEEPVSVACKPKGKKKDPGVCWEYNRNSCTRRRCRFTHACEVCSGSHPKKVCAVVRSGGGAN